MTQHRLSIVMCTYNGAAYLQPQLESLLEQTRRPDEIVFGDDGSTDATVSLLQAFALRARECDINVRFAPARENRGAAANFSATLQLASGDVLFLCDQDDVWRRDKLELMSARFAQDPQLLLLHSDARLVDSGGDSLGCSLFDVLRLTRHERQAIHEGRAFEVALRRSFVTGATAALRRQLTGLALPVGHDWMHDEWLAAVAAAIGRVDFISAPLVDYRQHENNQIGARRRTLAMKWQDLCRPRGHLLRVEAQRLQCLECFLNRMEFETGLQRAEQVGHKRAHFERRAAIGMLPRWRRLKPIAREAELGCYRSYGTGARSMLRDLLRHD
jgi:glycosyltransferase involved in cell wall biosynthesis